MAKVNVYTVDQRERKYIVRSLFLILSSLNSLDEVFSFLSGFVTPSEALMLGRRIEIAKLLAAGNSHEDIRKKLKVSFQTITKMEHWLKSDENRNLLIKKKIALNERGGKNNNRKMYSMLDKYAHHRFWKELLG